MPERPAIRLFIGAVAVAVMTVALAYAIPSSPAPVAPVAVLGLYMVGPFTPAGPTFDLTVENAGGIPIVHLSATLYLNLPGRIEFQNVTPSNPLEPGRVISTSSSLVESAFVCEAMYSLVFDGIYSSGSPFSETLSVPLDCLAPS